VGVKKDEHADLQSAVANDYAICFPLPESKANKGILPVQMAVLMRIYVIIDVIEDNQD